MADVFLSYASEDRNRARALAEILEKLGWSVFWDRGIPAGKTFATVIQRAIEQASCVVVLWTVSAVQSSWVREEAEFGREKGALLPVLLDEVRPPLGFRHIQSASLVGWEGQRDHEGLDELLRAIQDVAPRPTSKQQLDFGDVFISYAREDRAYVEQLIKYLQDVGLSVWADNRIDYGELWWQTVVANLRSCLAMVVIMTRAAEESKWVDREILLADELGKPFFPLLLDGERFPLFVGTQHHVVKDGSMPPRTFAEALKKATKK